MWRATHPRDRRRRLHRLQLRAPPPRPHRRGGDRAGQADVRREPGRAGRPAPTSGSGWSSATSPTRRWSTRSSPSTTRWCTSPRSRTTTTPSRPDAVRADQPGRHVHRPRGGAEGRGPAAPRLHRRGVRRPRARRPRRFTEDSPTDRAAPTPPPRRAPTTWCGRGSAASACGRRSRAAPTTTAPGSTSRSSSPARSPTSSTAVGRGSTAPARTSATGSTSTTTARRCWRSSSAAGSARPT